MSEPRRASSATTAPTPAPALAATTAPVATTAVPAGATAMPEGSGEAEGEGRVNGFQTLELVGRE